MAGCVKYMIGVKEYICHDEHWVMCGIVNHYIVHLKLTLYVNCTGIKIKNQTIPDQNNNKNLMKIK